jgi:hypothetical protein
MSLSNNIQNTISETINLFIEEVSKKHNLNKNDLLNIWNGSREKSDEIIISKTQNNSDLNNLIKLSKNELIELCKSKSLKVTGSKQDLAERIIESENKTVTKTINTPNKIPIVKKLIEKIPSIHLKRNKFENFEHSETSFVFNNKTQKVYGKQNSDGSVSNLTAEDIDICNKYKFSYYIPENLDKIDNSKKEDFLDDLELEEELEDELEEEFEEELEEEEEEEEEYYEED